MPRKKEKVVKQEPDADTVVECVNPSCKDKYGKRMRFDSSNATACPVCETELPSEEEGE